MIFGIIDSCSNKIGWQQIWRKLNTAGKGLWFCELPMVLFCKPWHSFKSTCPLAQIANPRRSKDFVDQQWFFLSKHLRAVHWQKEYPFLFTHEKKKETHDSHDEEDPFYPSVFEQITHHQVFQKRFRF